MPILDHTMKALITVSKNPPVGTNLGLLHLMWTLASGGLLPERGALFPALQRIGLSEKVVRRAWSAFQGGQWQIASLLRTWQEYVQNIGAGSSSDMRTIGRGGG